MSVSMSSLRWAGVALLVSVPLWCAAQTATQPVPTASCPPLLNKTFPRLQDEKPQSLCQYAGKVVSHGTRR